MTDRHPLVGTIQQVFDADAWREAGGDVGDNSCFWKPAMIVSVTMHPNDEATAKVAWEHGRTTSGHFIYGMNHGKGAGEFKGVVGKFDEEVQPWTEAMSEESHHPAETEPPFNIKTGRLYWEIEGIASVEIEQTMMPNRYNVQNLWVDPEYQNLGIGTALMRIVLHDADLQGIELWTVPQWLTPDMKEPLIRFYKRLGFEWLGSSGYMRRISPTTTQRGEHNEVV